MTVAWLKGVLEKFNNGEADIWIEISGTMFPLCGKVDRSILTYELKDSPGIKRGEVVLTLRPCECSSKEENDDKGNAINFN